MEPEDKTKNDFIEKMLPLQKRLTELEAMDADREQQQIKRLATVVRDSNDAIMLNDLDGQITAWNRGSELAYGYSEKEALVMNIQRLTPPDKTTEYWEFIHRLIAGEKVPSFETQRVAKDGRIIDVWLTVTQVFDNTGKPVGVATTERDITQRKLREERMLRSERLAAIGQLAASVAHELRNPLGVIKNVIYYLNMLGLGKDNPDVKENLEIISTEIENSDKIISDLLEFSSLKQPALSLAEINAIIRETLGKLKVPADIKVVTELGENLPQIQVDTLQIQQVFYNLASNAIKAMEKGGTLTVSSCVAHDETMAIAFKDTGRGIPKENLQKILEPFFSTEKGTGLGLTVVVSLVESHGGRIEIESAVNKGSVFTVKLPIQRG